MCVLTVRFLAEFFRVATDAKSGTRRDVAVCSCRYVHYSDRRSGQDRRRTYDWSRERDLGVVNRRSGGGRRSTDAVV